MKVNKNQIWLDEEDEYLYYLLKLKDLENNTLPKEFHLVSEWSAIMTEKVFVKKRLRVLKELIGYDLSVAD